MSPESSHSLPIFTPFIHKWTSAPQTPDWIIDDEWCEVISTVGFGANVTAETTGFWKRKLRSVYKDDVGRRKVRMAVIALLSRDGLFERLGDVKCPVYWLHGTDDPIYSPVLAAEEIELFTGSRDRRFELVGGGAHYLNVSNPNEVELAMVDMVSKHWAV